MKAHSDWFRDFRRWFFNTSVDWSPSEGKGLAEAPPLLSSPKPLHPPFPLSAFEGSFMSDNPQQPDAAPAAADAKRELPRKAVDHTRSGESSDPAMPSDRDQKAGATGGLPSGVVQQAHRDVKDGMEDTSRALESDKAYDKLKK